MKRTANVLQAAANPALLEMKILSNHGADPRFGFLRKGKEQRWREVWERLRSGKSETEEPAKKSASMNLVDYESSSDVEEDQETLEATKKKRKLQLAREWSAKRVKNKGASHDVESIGNEPSPT